MTRLSLFIGHAARMAMLTAATCVANVTLAADAVLLSSTVPGYVPGMVVASTEPLSLPDGASATFLFQSGEMLRLRGPFEGVLDKQRTSPNEFSVARLVDAFRMQGVDASVIGGTRTASPGRARVAIEDVQIDPQRSATYCLQSSTSVWIARPAQEEGPLVLQRAKTSRTIAWPSGASRIEWPPNVPIEDGDQYQILKDGSAKATVRFRMMPQNASSGMAWIADGMLRGCQDQFSDPLRRLARATGPAELWVTSDRGRRPVYRPGEPIGLTINADSGGYLYCVSMRLDGKVVPIFPAGAMNNAQLHGSVPIALPGHRKQADLVAGPSGPEQIRCWLADRDISAELPHAMLDSAMTPLPEQLARDVDGIFAGIKGSQIARASLDVRVR